MDIDVARTLAHRVHAGQLTRSGEPLIDHIERVADAVPTDSAALAYLHEVLEKAAGAPDELREHELSDFDYAVLGLLTHDPKESYRTYVLRIATSEGHEGRVAREIKRADLDDHLHNRRSAFGGPNYQWATAQMIEAQLAKCEIPPLESVTLGRVA